MATKVFLIWLVLFGSKFVILKAVDLAFGDDVEFGGLITFVIVVMTLLVAEQVLARVHRLLIRA